MSINLSILELSLVKKEEIKIKEIHIDPKNITKKIAIYVPFYELSRKHIRTRSEDKKAPLLLKIASFREDRKLTRSDNILIQNTLIAAIAKDVMEEVHDIEKNFVTKYKNNNNASGNMIAVKDFIVKTLDEAIDDCNDIIIDMNKYNAEIKYDNPALFTEHNKLIDSAKEISEALYNKTIEHYSKHKYKI
jgi:hypothetical protein